MAVDFARWRAELKSEMDEAESRRAFASTFGDLQRVAEQAAATRDEYRDRIAAIDALPRMLSALENLVGGSTAAEIINGIGDDANGRIRVTGRCVREAFDALRAAREAVKP